MTLAQPLLIRAASPSDFGPLEALVIDAFESITWQKKLDAQIGPLNGRTWRDRWSARLRNIFTTQLVLVGEAEGQLAAMASATIDRDSALAFIDVLCVGRAFQGLGYGRDMLRAAMNHYRQLGCQYVNLDCLTDNEAGNALYTSEGFQEVARHIRWFRKLDQ
jgi:RimJ/RimL family protein N-acetyltransferase